MLYAKSAAARNAWNYAGVRATACDKVFVSDTSFVARSAARLTWVPGMPSDDPFASGSVTRRLAWLEAEAPCDWEMLPRGVVDRSPVAWRNFTSAQLVERITSRTLHHLPRAPRPRGAGMRRQGMLETALEKIARQPLPS
jgi:hypothetical protein